MGSQLLLRHTWESGAAGPGLRDKGISFWISIPKSPNPGGFGASQDGLWFNNGR